MLILTLKTDDNVYTSPMSFFCIWMTPSFIFSVSWTEANNQQSLSWIDVSSRRQLVSLFCFSSDFLHIDVSFMRFVNVAHSMNTRIPSFYFFILESFESFLQTNSRLFFTLVVFLTKESMCQDKIIVSFSRWEKDTALFLINEISFCRSSAQLTTTDGC